MKKILLLVSALIQFYCVNAEDWRAFRGPTGMGVTEQKIPPHGMRTPSHGKEASLGKDSLL